MTGKARLPTSADVARRAGVARSTVSYVLNDTPGARISGATRRRVLAAAAELGYVTNRAAADLRRGTTRLVLGVLDRERVGSLAPQYLAAFTEVLSDLGMTLMVTVADGEVSQREAYEWAALRPTALVAFRALLTEPALQVMRGAGTVVISDQPTDVQVVVNQARLAEAAVAALHERGRYRLLQVIAAEDSQFELSRARVPAFEAAAGPAGLGTVRLANDESAAARLVAELAQWPTRPEGIVAHSDECAAMLVGALLDAGYAVPGDIAVLGGDNAVWAQWTRPALSTVALHPRAVVDQLVGLLTAIVEDRAHPSRIVMETDVVVIHRQTT